MNTFTFADQLGKGTLAEDRCSRWLTAQPATVWVRNVTKEASYQRRDVDLIWAVRSGHEVELEVKGDLHTTNNFFFETVSNTTLNTPGCFMYTEAKYIAYVFERKDTMYLLNTHETRSWFCRNESYFARRKVATKVGENGVKYETEGCIVPIAHVLDGVRDAKCVTL